MVRNDIHVLANQHLPGDYTVERREFTDGSYRVTAVHAIGHGELGNRTEYRLWRDKAEIWVEYYEGDTRRDRRVYSINLKERAV